MKWTDGPREVKVAIDSETAAMVALAGSVTAGYLVIGLVVAPRMRMPSASSRVLLLVRTAAIIFFIACALTHLHIVAHTLAAGGIGRPVEGHDLVIHLVQAVASWLFIVGAALKLELHVVPSDRSAQQRDVARAQLAEQQVISAALERRAAKASALARISEEGLTQRDLAVFAHDAASVVRAALSDRCTVTLADRGDRGNAEDTGDHLLVIKSTGDSDDGDKEFISSVNNLLANAARRLQLEEQLRHRSLHDPLTGLPNRVLLLDRLEQTLTRQLRTDDPLSVLFVDLDGFKKINDAFGHEVGDRLLIEVAARLDALSGPEDTLARQSGDEFVMVCEGTAGKAAVDIARRVVDSLGRPCALAEGVVRVTASVGIATSDAGCDAEELLHRADAAMYHAKRSGPGGVETFGEALQARTVRSDQFERDLRKALTRGELSLVYQPIVAMAAPGAPDRGDRRRSTPAVAPPGARPRLPRLLHPPGGGPWADRPDRRLGHRPGLRTGGALARPDAGDPRPAGDTERVGLPARPAGLRVQDHGRSAGSRRPA